MDGSRTSYINGFRSDIIVPTDKLMDLQEPRKEPLRSRVRLGPGTGVSTRGLSPVLYVIEPDEVSDPSVWSN